MSAHRGWIGVDLDGTLAEYDGWQGVAHIGSPVAPMVERVKRWLAAGITVKIVTARCAHAEPGVVRAVEDWCEEHIGQRLPVTCSKDFGMIELWDDRCVQVVPNTGIRVDGAEEEAVIPALIDLLVAEEEARVMREHSVGHTWSELA